MVNLCSRSDIDERSHCINEKRLQIKEGGGKVNVEEIVPKLDQCPGIFIIGASSEHSSLFPEFSLSSSYGLLDATLLSRGNVGIVGCKCCNYIFPTSLL